MQLFGYDVLSFEGRMNRKPYLLIPILFNLVQLLVISLIGGEGLLPRVIDIFIVVVSLSFHVRRAHDLELSGWWCLLLLVPLINIVFVLYMTFAKGTDGPNKYGPDPLAEL